MSQRNLVGCTRRRSGRPPQGGARPADKVDYERSGPSRSPGGFVKGFWRALLPLCLAASAVFVYAQRHPPNRDPWTYRGNDTWDSSWNRRPHPRDGACFFTSANYSGNHFCVRRGDRLPSLPRNFGDNLSSIRTFGKSRVMVFNDRNFSGGSQEFRSSVPDLRNRRFRDGHTWNNRVSSIAVR
jgi:hypothetical protein